MISMRGFTCQRLFQDSIICQGGAVQAKLSNPAFKARLKMKKLMAIEFETGRKKNNLLALFLKCGS